MNNKKSIVMALVAFLIATNTQAQDAAMADGLRSEGKIYVVVLIILIVLSGLIAYLFFVDRKIKRLEQFLKEKFQTKR